MLIEIVTLDSNIQRITQIFQDRLGRYVWVQSDAYPQYTNYLDVMVDRIVSYLDQYSKNLDCNRYLVIHDKTIILPPGVFDKADLKGRIEDAMRKE